MRQPVSTPQSGLGIPSEATTPKLRPQRPAFSAWNSRVAARLRQVAHGLSLRQVAEQTRTNSETVRRYMRSGKPCVRFLARFCEEFGVSADVILGLAASPTRHSAALRAAVAKPLQAPAISVKHPLVPPRPLSASPSQRPERANPARSARQMPRAKEAPSATPTEPVGD
jgi:transcriptional regulator with XRE-family HTH domain